MTTSEIAAAGHLKPRTMLRVVDHAYAGNRIGRTVNDLAAALVRLSRG